MIDLADIFYVLGIIFFVTCFVFLFAIFVFVLSVRNKVNTLRNQMPAQVISYLRGNNTTQLKALGIAFIGFLISFARSRMQGKK